MTLSKPRLELLQKSAPKEKSYSVSCITTYTPQAHIVRDTITKHWPILASDPTLAQLFNEPPLFVYRRGPNLRNKLVRANIKPSPKQTRLFPLKNGNYPCGHCAQCCNAIKSNVFRHLTSGRIFRVRGFITCSTENVIYTLRCECNKIYVGKTTRKLKQRISEHKSSIRRNDINYPVARHFNECSHPISSLRFQGIEHIEMPRGGDMEKRLCQRELYWIDTLNALHPGTGLNEDFDMRVLI